MNKKKIRAVGKMATLFLLFAIPIFMMADTIQKKISLDSANKEVKSIIQFVEEQCTRYDSLITLNKVRTQVELAGKALALKRDMQYRKETISRKRLKEFLDDQRLTGAIILDQNGDLLVEAKKDDIGYEFWKEVLQDVNIKDTLKKEKKILIDMKQTGNWRYDYVAVSRKDMPGIIFCYRQLMQEESGDEISSIENLLNGYKIDKDGTILLTDGEKVVSSNDAAMKGRQIKESPLIMKFNENWEADRLTRVLEQGRVYYGRHVKCGQYYIYIFFDKDKIFEERLIVMGCILSFYLCFWVMLIVSRHRIERSRMAELERQHNISRAIGKIYEAYFLIDVEKNSLEILKGTPGLQERIKQYHGAADMMEGLIDGYIAKEYWKSSREFVNLANLEERLGEEEFLTHTYQDVNGGWHFTAMIPKKRLKNGKIVSVIFTVRDVTAQREKELTYQNQILEALQEAEQANAAKTEFLRRMSHDIRTPINGIMGMLDIADRFPEDTEKLRECRQKIRDASGFLFALVNDVLDMSKMESGEIVMEAVPFDLRDLLNDVVSLIEVQAMEMGLSFSYEREPEDAVWNLIGSPVHLHQLLVNIAGNAVKYNKPGGSLHLKCMQKEADENHAVFVFVCSDTGIGMDREFQRHMFEPFAQEQDGARTKLNGTGLGLSIVQKLVTKMEGTVEVESEKDQGTTFTVTIPFLIDRAAQKADRERETKKVCSIRGMKILLVEDNELNMEIAQFLLEDEGAIVTKAWNGQEAVEIFADAKPGSFDVILMDIMMPVMDGMTATKTIRAMEREDAASIPIIAMTANAFTDDIRRHKSAGMNEQISKPLELEKMKETLVKYRFFSE